MSTRTSMRCSLCITVIALLLLAAAPVTAQQSSAPAATAVQPSAPAAPDDSVEMQTADNARQRRADAWRPLRIAKWTTAAGTAGAALYGFIQNRRADDRFEELEQVCVDTPMRCTTRLPNGAYADEQLERDYQEVRAIDGRARTALIASQIGVAASVVMFIIDLRNTGAPENIPYEPRSFDIGPARDGGLSLRMQVPLGH